MNNNITISNPDRIIFKKGKISKLDIVNYYSSICEYMFPYLKDRLISVIRCHNTTDKEVFFKKHPTIKNQNIKGKIVEGNEYFYLNNKFGIINQVQMGTLEFHTWASQIDFINKPDIMTFDLDPDTKVSAHQLKQGVLDLKNILDELNLTSYLKTSGGKGFHILVPFQKSCNWKKFNNFAEQIALLMEQKWGNKYTTNIRKSERKGKIFIDYLRNKKGATCVAPFSVRAKDKPTVSMPISWSDLKTTNPQDYTIFNVLEKIKQNNPWKDFFKINQKIF